MKSKPISVLSYGITIATLILLAFNLFGIIEVSYWIVLSPILALLAGFVLVLVLSIIIGSIAYVFKKDKIGERKKTLEDAKEELRQKLKKEADEELEAWRKAYVKREQKANIKTINEAGKILKDIENPKKP